MNRSDATNRWWISQTDHAGWFLNGDTTALLVSLAVHIFVLLALGLVPSIVPQLAQRVMILVPDEQTVPLELVERTFEVPVLQERSPDAGNTGLSSLDESLPTVGDIGSPLETADGPGVFSGSPGEVTLDEMTANHRAAMIADVAGLRGATVNSRGDTGSVDRITSELLTQLEQGNVLVAWLMDASESLRPRRQEIIQHFDRVYSELDELLDSKREPLLTTVAAFGERVIPMIRKPTADRAQIQRSVREIKGDESGVENVFSAIKQTAQAYAKWRRGGRKVVMIVVTDERGDDLSELEEALTMLKRYDMSVYVMGPLSPFGVQQVKVKWTDRNTDEVFMLPVDLGPETARVEHAKLALWRNGPGSRPISSGFGPYGLTRITVENGGLYLVHDDGLIAGPNFSVDTLLSYRPDYMSAVRYTQLNGDAPLRRAVVRTAQASNAILEDRLETLFLAAGIQFELREARKNLSKVADVVARGLGELRAVNKLRINEPSPRWRANYDLMMGRLLANKLRCISYGRLLEDMYVRPRAPQDGTKNAWEMVPVGAPPSEPDADGSDSQLARNCLQRVMAEHPDTPWAILAQRELEFAFAFDWQEAFKDPPEGVPLPWAKVPWKELTDAQKAAMQNYDKKKKVAAARKKKTVAAKSGPAGTKRTLPRL